MTAAQVPDEVRRHAPVVHLHSGERYGPMNPNLWLERARLQWYERTSFEVVPGSPLELFRRAREGDFTSHGHRLTDLTRPWQRGRPSDDLILDGFALTAAADAATSAAASPVPVFYDHVPGRYVTYWLFYPWSTVPLGIPGLHRGLEDFGPAETDEAGLALLDAYPDLVHVATPPGERGLERLPPRREIVGYVRAWLGPRWPVLHEGDWEGVSLSLDPGRPCVAYFQHGCPQLREPGADGAPHVYVASGSHASYPDVGRRSPGSPKVKWFEHLEEAEPREIELFDVRTQPWYGFGGAWGARGSDSDETGPLGPGEAKGPRPFA